MMLRPKGVAIHSIKRAVAHHFGLSPVVFDGDRRTREVARPRQVAMYLAKMLTSQSYPEIGRAFGGRDHTTVMHAVRKIEELCDADPAFDALVRQLARVIPEKITLPASLPPDLDEASRLAVLNVVRSAKDQPDSSCTGDTEAIRHALYELYDETPFLQADCRDGNVIEILASPNGSWTLLHLIGDRAQISAVGGGIETLRDVVTDVVPDPADDEPAAEAPEPVSPPADQRRTRKCNRCGEDFVSPHFGKRRCNSCDKAIRRDGSDVAEAV